MSVELDWIDEDTIVAICRKLIKEGRPKSTSLDFRNVVDPFCALFDLAVNNMTFSEWKQSEILRQQQKPLQNAIEKFHQTVLSSLPGWQNQRSGNVLDLRNDERKIVAVVKNKFNTIKQSDEHWVYTKLANWLGSDASHRQYTAYYVQILTKEGRFDRPFTPSNKAQGTKPQPKKNIREIDGRSFYHLVTGSPTALDDLYEVLPDILEMATDGTVSASNVRAQPLFKELIQKLP